jgi:hypothetical protein
MRSSPPGVYTPTVSLETKRRRLHDDAPPGSEYSRHFETPKSSTLMPPPPIPRRQGPPTQRGRYLQGFQKSRPASRVSEPLLTLRNATPLHTRRRLTTPYTPNGASRPYKPLETPRKLESGAFRSDFAKSGAHSLSQSPRAEPRGFRPDIANERQGNPSSGGFTPAGRTGDESLRRLSAPYDPNGQLRPPTIPRPEAIDFRPNPESDYQRPASAADFSPSSRRPRQSSGINDQAPRNGTSHIPANDPFEEFRFNPKEGLVDMPSEGRPNVSSRAWTSTPSNRGADTSGRATHIPTKPGPIMRSKEPHESANATLKAPTPQRAGLNALSFVDVPYSAENQPLASPRHHTAADSTPQKFHRSVAVPHWADHSSSTHTPGPNLRPRRMSLGRTPGSRNGESCGFSNVSHNFYSDHLKPQKRVSMASAGPYSFGIRSSRAGRTLSRPL